MPGNMVLQRTDSMVCRDVYSHLCGYLDGELDSEIAEVVESHLKLCQFCRRELEILRSVASLVQGRSISVSAPDSLRCSLARELRRAEEYRDSGVDALGLIRWGTHIGQLYKNKDDLAEIVVPYLEKGLEENELCVWVTSDISRVEAEAALLAKFPSIDEYIDRGQLQLFSHEDWFSPNGRFDVQHTLSNGIEKCREALSKGYSGLRITGDIIWLELADWDSFMEYEELLNSKISSYRILVMCAYKESRCSKDNIVDVMNIHRCVLSKTGDLWRLRKTSELGNCFPTY